MKIRIDFRELKKFWNFLTYRYPEGALVEIILMGIKNPIVYEHVKRFSELNPSIIVKKNCQFFINKFEDLKNILQFSNFLFIKHTKICYSISPRFAKGDKVTGGYDYMKMIDFIFLDIEKQNHEKLSENDEPYIKLFTNSIVNDLKQYGLTKPVIIHSGNGEHILYKVRGKKFDDKRKEGYKQFIIELEQRLNSEIFHIDHCVNSSRCIALPFTWNHKAGKQVTLMSEIPEDPINHFFIKSTTKRKTSVSLIDKKDLPAIKKSREWQVMTHPDPPQGSMHTIVLFGLKLLIKELGLSDDEISELEDEMNSVRGTHHKLDMEAGIDGKTWSPGIMRNFLIKNRAWAEKNNMI